MNAEGSRRCEDHPRQDEIPVDQDMEKPGLLQSFPLDARPTREPKAAGEEQTDSVP